MLCLIDLSFSSAPNNNQPNFKKKNTIINQNFDKLETMKVLVETHTTKFWLKHTLLTTKLERTIVDRILIKFSIFYILIVNSEWP